MGAVERKTVHADCVCDAASWSKNHGTVCETPDFDDALGVCFNCGHDKRCHKDYWELFGEEG